MEYYIDEKSGKAEGTSRKASWNQKEQRNSLDREDKNSITEKKIITSGYCSAKTDIQNSCFTRPC